MANDFAPNVMERLGLRFTTLESETWTFVLGLHNDDLSIAKFI
jgi:hypothetical protein